MTTGQNLVRKLNAFINVVKTGSAYDLRLQDEWKQTIPYNNMITEAQDVGNFHYGYIGRAAGFDVSTLTLGAGHANYMSIGISQ